MQTLLDTELTSTMDQIEALSTKTEQQQVNLTALLEVLEQKVGAFRIYEWK